MHKEDSVEAAKPSPVAPFQILSVDQKAAAGERWKGRVEFVLLVLNMAKNVLGALILLLPWTIARCGWALGVVSTAFVGCMCAYTFTLIGRCCHARQVTSYPEIFRKIYPEKAWVPHMIDVSVVILNFCTIVSFTIVAGDTLPSVLGAWFNFKPSFEAFVAVLSVTVLFPVSIPRDLSSIRHISFIGIAGLLFIVLSSVAIVSRKGVHQEVSATPRGWIVEVISAFTIIGGVFDAHTNAPEFYKESVLNHGYSLKSFSKAVYCCMAIVFIAATTFSLSGYFTFGPYAQDDVLRSYQTLATLSPGTWVAGVASVMSFLAALSVIISYALFFNALRQSVTRLLLQVVPDSIRTRFEPEADDFQGASRSTLVYRGLEALETLVIIVLSSTIAYFVHMDGSFSLFVGVIWSIFGSMTVYILPTIAALDILDDSLSPLERAATWSILIFGIVFSAGCGFVTTVILWAGVTA